MMWMFEEESPKVRINLVTVFALLDEAHRLHQSAGNPMMIRTGNYSSSNTGTVLEHQLLSFVRSFSLLRDFILESPRGRNDEDDAVLHTVATSVRRASAMIVRRPF